MSKSNKNNSNKDNDGSSVHIHGAITAHPPESFINQKTAERKEDAAKHITERNEDIRRDTKKVRLELVTCLAVVIYAGIAAWQGCLMRQSIDNNTKQFHTDQRPYLWTGNIKPQLSIVANRRMWVNIHLIDYGKSPALKARVTGQIFIGPDAKQNADQWFAAIGDKPITDPDESGIVVPPGVPAPMTKDMVEGSGFGGGGFFTVLSDRVLTQPDVDYILNTDESAVIVARFQYFDGFGNRYWSNICLSRFINGNIPYCVKHNEIH